MENKKKNKIEISKFEFEKTFIYSALIVAYFVFGLYIGENSAGDMLAFYILYQLISLFHTYIFLSMLR